MLLRVSRRQRTRGRQPFLPAGPMLKTSPSPKDEISDPNNALAVHQPAWMLLVLVRKAMTFIKGCTHFDCHKLNGMPLAAEPGERTHLCSEKRLDSRQCSDCIGALCCSASRRTFKEIRHLGSDQPLSTLARPSSAWREAQI
jgi:hypothetical protein